MRRSRFRLLGALANSRGHRHEENAAKLVRTALEQPIQVGAALLASAEGYTPRANKHIDEAREQLGSIQDVALALADNLPAPKQQASRNRRRRRRKKKGAETVAATATTAEQNETAAEGETPAKPKRRRRRKKPASAQGAADGGEQVADVVVSD